MFSGICVLLCALLLTGCAGLRGMERLTLLDDTSLLYERALFTGNYRAAHRFIKSDENSQTPDFYRLKKMKVSSYNLVDKTTSPDNKKAQRIYEIGYFNEDYLVEKLIIDEQRWEYDDEIEQWYIRSGLPKFK